MSRLSGRNKTQAIDTNASTGITYTAVIALETPSNLAELDKEQVKHQSYEVWRNEPTS